MLKKFLQPIAAVPRGVGQIMLQGNVWTGLLFLIGIFYDSVTMGVGALLATAIGTGVAVLLKYPPEEIAQGLYGFSAALVGVALTFYFEAQPVIWVALVIGSALAAIFQHALIKRNIPGFTLPFIVITWVFLFLFRHLYMVPPSSEVTATLPVYQDFTVSTHGFGEVIFQGSMTAGLLFFLGVFVSSPISALYGMAASVVGAYISMQFAEPMDDVHMGLFSFNAVLCAITFAGNRKRDGLYVLVSVVLAVLIDVGMLMLDMTVLTFPFVLASWLTLLIKKIFDKK
ncbi:urea transporter [Chitinophaga jiangningensis]|uniref:Urea transporter n=1 Tax=Chitinophaga jiangningensis TaxID=1419482 RepID=A0A1M7K212_9BACT|nr:urea transporter [Chitinophaga jiangningensis]SHM59319.1 urea transporter [Chitinophaga jiangningensis]